MLWLSLSGYRVFLLEPFAGLPLIAAVTAIADAVVDSRGIDVERITLLVCASARKQRITHTTAPGTTFSQTGGC